jgi:hypothetical protein
VDLPRSGQYPVAGCCEQGPLICMKSEHVLGYVSDNLSRRDLLHGVSLVIIQPAAVTTLRKKRGRGLKDTRQLLLLVAGTSLSHTLSQLKHLFPEPRRNISCPIIFLWIVFPSYSLPLLFRFSS